MIAVLPILLYPLLGMSYFAGCAISARTADRMLIVGLPDLPELPPLVVDNHFDPQWLSDPTIEAFQICISRPVRYCGVVAAGDEGKEQDSLTGRIRSRGGVSGRFCDAARRISRNNWASNSADRRIPLRNRFPSRSSTATPPTRNLNWPTPAWRTVLDRWADAIGKQNLEDSQAARRHGPAVRIPASRRFRSPAAQRRDVVENSAVCRALVGAYRGVLSGHRSVRRRKGTWHVGNAAVQPGPAQRNRHRQIADRHVVQRRHQRAESGEHGT